MSHFNLPEGLTECKKSKVKEWALNKMATQFHTFKKKLYNDYIKEKKTPTFTGPLEKIKNHWEYKESSDALERSKKIRQML